MNIDIVDSVEIHSGQTLKDEYIEVLQIYTGDESGAFALAEVERVLRASALIKLPDLSTHFEGLLNLNGRVIPVIDLRHRLGMDGIPIEPEHFFVLINCSSGLTAVRSERTPQLKSFEGDYTENLSGFGACPELLKGVVKIDGAPVPLYNPEKLFSQEDFTLAKSFEELVDDSSLGDC
jgi:purine-binding chemotaxis protein CheW